MPETTHIRLPEAARTVIFDQDGVLIDSWDSSIHYFNRIRQEMGLGPMSRDQEDYSFIHTVDQSIDHITPDHLKHLIPQAKATVRFEELLPLVKLQPGIVEFLERLRDAGFKLAVDTNGGIEQHMILEHVGLLHLFHKIVTTADVAEGKPSPEGVHAILGEFDLNTAQALFIGDSSIDMRTANNAGVTFWAYRNSDLKAGIHLADYGSVLLP
ncbi:HAD family hydrolase [Pseudodesulfovibrio tunisiensis]|uniref:HAD family hydrolase n=1 Tax=Pseudodesulfovibrio tunisiensis TaxID=463192 RepID=UPI001FB39BF0|nr:HAD family hydrolase [Pseudodesulfovibrio tunisiensis]